MKGSGADLCHVFSARATVVALVVLLVAALAIGVVATQTGDVATADGTIVTGDTRGLFVAAVPSPLVVDAYEVPETLADIVLVQSAPPGSFKSTFWGYEAASSGARILEYDIGPAGTGPVTPVATCMPPFTENGRGVAFDPLDGNLWYTRVNFITPPAFGGDGFIHKATPPSLGCAAVTSLPFGDGPGGTIQDDIGALDVDQGSKHIWAAGYQPVVVGGVPLSFLYLVNRNNGQIIHSCAIPFGDGGAGNDTLAYARLSGLPGSGQYRLTDAGETFTTPNSLAVIDTAQCKNGTVVTPVASFVKTAPMSGIEFEWMGLPSTNGSLLRNHGGPPFALFVVAGPWVNSLAIEDISACGFRALLGGGGGNDMCPYP